MKNLFPFAPPVIAHRGASKLAPENTLIAFEKVRETGASWVEFDVMLAGCGEAVVIHDETLDRTTNAKGLVIDYPYSYLQTLDAGSWFDPCFAGAKIPTLTEVITVLRRYKLAANIEIKPSEGHEEATVKKVLQVIKDNWHDDMPKPLISSFSPIVLENVRNYSATHFLAYLMHEWQPDWQQAADQLDCVSVHLSQKILDAERAAEIKMTGRFLLSYTIDEPARAKEIFSWGTDAIFSNCPAEMYPLLRCHPAI